MAPSYRTSISNDVDRVMEEESNARSRQSEHIVSKLLAHSGFEG